MYFNAIFSGMYRKDKAFAYAHVLASLKRNSSYAPAFHLMGLLYLDQDDTVRAIKCLQRSLDVAPGYVDGLLDLCEVGRGDVGMVERAIEKFLSVKEGCRVWKIWKLRGSIQLVSCYLTWCFTF
jgi:tetratricopeptide (TPR) repeat protein